MAEDPDGITAEAAAWHAKLAAGDIDSKTRAAFEAWRDASPQRALAYAELEDTWRLALRAADTPRVLALRHETLTRLLVSRRSVGVGAVAAITVAVILGAVGWLVVNRNHQTRDRLAAASAVRTYQTGVGERLTIGLADGSTVVLNTASRLRVCFSDRQRHVVVEAGEALFEVAKDQQRPFVVTAANQNITAHGTKFVVRLNREQLMVALMEGVVSVRRQDMAAASELSLKPNDMLIAEGETTSVRHIADATLLISWREGLVIFKDETLSEAAAEMNRYVERPRIEVRPKVAQLRLSGAFRTGQTADFAEALVQGFPVAIVERSKEHIVLGQARRSH